MLKLKSLFNMPIDEWIAVIVCFLFLLATSGIILYVGIQLIQ